MISEEKAMHILGVARKCFQLARERGMSERDCQRAFIAGWLHDIGYEFGHDGNKNFVGADMVSLLMGATTMRMKYAVENQGIPGVEMNPLLEVLNLADLQVNERGEDVGFETRLEDIKEHFGENSPQYKNALELMNQLIYKGVERHE